MGRNTLSVMFDHLTPPIWLHFIAAAVALVAGALVLILPKGSWLHRRLGAAYIVSMIVTVAAAAVAPATVMRFGGTRFGFFHVFVLVGAISLALGVGALVKWRRSRSAKALRFHQMHLAYSYAGLVMAGFSQLATNPRFGMIDSMTRAQFWWSFGLTNAAIYAVATWLIQTRVARHDPLRFVRGGQASRVSPP